MPVVLVDRIMLGVRVEEVWAIASRLTDYPRFMEQVISVDELSAAGENLITSWTVLFNGNELRWTERDRFDLGRTTMSFEQIEGDLRTWRGHFRLESLTENRVRGSYEVEFDLGVPALADLLHPLGERAIRANCSIMLESIERLLHERADASS